MADRSPVEADLDALSGERALVAALLRTAVVDARSQAKGRLMAQRQAKARAWLRDKGAVLYWLELVGLPEWVYDRLLREAGMEE